MSASSGVPLGSSLEQLWHQAHSVNTIRAIIIQIEGDQFVNKADVRSSVSIKRDFEGLSAVARSPCFILFRLSGKDSWLLVSYVLDSCAVHDKMLYASSKSSLLKGLGAHYITAELQVSTPSDLSYANYEATVIPSSSPKPYSQHEIIHHEILKEEEAERSFRATLRSAPGSPSASSSSGSGIGGYHTVTIPLDPGAVAALTSPSSLIAFAINEDHTAVLKESESSSSDIASIKTKISTTEPRFYLYRTAGKQILIYSCPDKSPPKLRMVYSTAKPSIKSQIEQKLHVSLKTVEIRGPEDVSADTFATSHATSYGYTRPGTPSPSAKVSHGTQTPHPVYNMIAQAQGSSPRATTKKIVIPPPGAY